jgi:hypothetical protein
MCSCVAESTPKPRATARATSDGPSPMTGATPPKPTRKSAPPTSISRDSTVITAARVATKAATTNTSCVPPSTTGAVSGDPGAALTPDGMGTLAQLATRPQGSRSRVPPKYQRLVDTIAQDGGNDPDAPTSASATNADTGSPPAEAKKTKPKPKMRPVPESQPACGNGTSTNTPEGQQDRETSKPAKKQKGKPVVKGASVGGGASKANKAGGSGESVVEGEQAREGPSTGKTGRKKQPKASSVRCVVPRRTTY